MLLSSSLKKLLLYIYAISESLGKNWGKFTDIGQHAWQPSLLINLEEGVQYYLWKELEVSSTSSGHTP